MKRGGQVSAKLNHTESYQSYSEWNGSMEPKVPNSAHKRKYLLTYKFIITHILLNI